MSAWRTGKSPARTTQGGDHPHLASLQADLAEGQAQGVAEVLPQLPHRLEARQLSRVLDRGVAVAAQQPAAQGPGAGVTAIPLATADASTTLLASSVSAAPPV